MRNQASSARWLGILIFLLALALRLLFWQSTPDSSWSYSAYYKGDAPTWLANAKALQEDRRFEAGLPFRPPGNAYLLAMIWDGSRAGVSNLKLI